ncbi:bifunctional lysylphosphatidylglycerol flippase/synthetase MprF [Nocardia sp. NPDC052566]|uniref:bifunctional lysylphosphatidylglycerol flippase/synthetase MprF n=1 Tax=Nocardia sp. NPDC052566 TaxID=3364330 RepID=UPI0037CA7FD5
MEDRDVKSAQVATRLDCDLAVEVLRRSTDNPSAFLAMNQRNALFATPEIDGFVCYRAVGKYWVQFGGPFAAAPDRPALLRRFLDEARARRRRVLAVQVQQADARIYAELGMRVNQAGASYAVDLATMSLKGKKFVSLRNKISRAKRAGLKVTEIYSSAFADGYSEVIADIDHRWLREKGKHVKELEFLIGEIGGPAQKYRRLFVGSIDDAPVGYLSYAPVYGSHGGWLHDLSRRVPEAPPGVMEAINLHAIEQFRDNGADWLHFGFTPFTSLDPSYELPTASKPVSRIVRLLADKGELVYPAKTQLEYKLKWNPTAVIPEYIAYKSLTPRAIWSLIRATNSI